MRGRAQLAGLLLAATCAIAAGGALADDDTPAEEAPAEEAPSDEAPSEAAPGAEEKPALPEPPLVEGGPGADAFVRVTQVLQSPRCMNCHPMGDRPLQTDDNVPHAMNISRQSIKAGVPCSTCHQTENSERVGVPGGPPGAPHWNLPPEDVPMVFQGHTPRSLCMQLRDPAQNGQRSLQDLLEHVAHDALVLWGWEPGGKRSKPPQSHKDFVDSFRTWVESGGACPK